MRSVTEVTSFKTSDGKVFEHESDAENHQFRLDLELEWNSFMRYVSTFQELCDALNNLNDRGFITLHRKLT